MSQDQTAAGPVRFPGTRPSSAASQQAATMAGVEINCWHLVGVTNAPRDRVRCRRRPAREVSELRAAIRAARAGEGDGVLYELPRGYGPRGRAVARSLIGVSPVLVLGGLVALVVSASAVGAILVVLGALVGGTTWALATVTDTGVRITADGVLRAEGWGGVEELQLRDYPRVTVRERQDNDGTMWIE